METLLIYNDDLSNKFWKIHVSGNTFTITYGKIGTSGSVKTKKFETKEDCKKESEKLIKTKIKKGYKFSQSSQLVVKESSMTEALFWELLKKCKLKGEYAEEQIEWLITHLSKKSIKDIVKFDYIFNTYYKTSYTSELWAAAYIILGGCSDDCFDYFRAWVLYLGKKEYETAINDPQTLLPYLQQLNGYDDIPQLEELISVAILAYEEKTGLDDESYYDIYSQLTNDSHDNPDIDLDWDEDDEEQLRSMFPLLWDVYGENPLT
ncbi:DUF4240 domain-containing protein [Bacillus massiliigorillae]|uniref:DUF4240 domain-containing protein n=1 Tax=Bacillus massiliigorillae TaxID=1243664 RepID=UPI0003A5429A|nr:DUF4240 domain-containing protein [Bacillus massiliigorillae]